MIIDSLYRDFFFFNSIQKMKGVYCISCRDPQIPDFYIGYTTNLRNRINQHRFFCYYEKDKRYNLPIYTIIRNNGGFDNWEFNMIEENCGVEREKYWYEALNPTMNTNHCGHTALEYKRKYYASEKGRETILRNCRKKIKCEFCGKIMNKSSISRHKLYYCPNKKYKIELKKEKVEINF